MESISALRLLSNIIAQAVDTIEGVYADAGVALPALDEPFNPKDPAEAVRQDPDVAAATMNLVAAAAQIAAAVRDPVMSAMSNAHSFQIASCVRTASELNVVEILREAGPKGMHVKEIATPSHTNADLLARILRLLATHHMFREVAPNVFANNRISSALDKGKPSSILFENREDRLTGTSGAAALTEFLGDECFKTKPLMRAFGLDEPMFNWLKRPENRHRINRFALGMHGTAASEPPGLIFEGFDWSALPNGSVLVDVGGGLGSTSMAIAKRNLGLRIVNQDLGPTIEQAKLYWKEQFPEHVEKQMVELQAHDFFQQQPVKNADIFMMRHVIHDWSDERTIVILTRLREAAMPTTRLVIVENIVPLASRGESGDPNTKAVPGAARPSAPPPLLPNWGVAAASLYYYDVTLHNLVGGGKRTLEAFADVLAKSGWDLAQVHHCPRSQLSHLVAIPT
ncbi:O-methyltransferase [Mycena sp. CBHHK59/15]|nr:O-methyltransferase [Mycena sp. CBHHK59/15]